MSELLEIAGSMLIAAATALVILSLWPKAVPAAVDSGERGMMRRDALRASGLFRATDPVIRVLARSVAVLLPKDLRGRADTMAQSSGHPLGLDGDGVLALSLLTSLGFATAGGATSAWLGKSVGAGMVLGSILGFSFPWFKLQDIAKRRLVSFARGLPGVIDLIVLAMESGLDFTGALKQVSSRLDPKNPIRFELVHIQQKLSLGWSRREALESLAERIPILPIKQFTSAVIQAEKRGTPLKEVLAIQAEVMRTKRSQNAEQAAARAAVLILGPLMLIFACVFAIILGPFAVKYIRGDLF